MPQPTASQNTVNHVSTQRLGSIASTITWFQLFLNSAGETLRLVRHDPNQQQPDDSSSITSSDFVDLEANLQTDCNQQHPFDRHSTGSSDWCSVGSYRSGASCPSEEQETGHEITQYNDQNTAISTDHHDIDNRVSDEPRIIRRHNQLQRCGNENPMLPNATQMTVLTGRVRAISDWIGNLGINVAHLYTRFQGQFVTVYNTVLTSMRASLNRSAFILLNW